MKKQSGSKGLKDLLVRHGIKPTNSYKKNMAAAQKILGPRYSYSK